MVNINPTESSNNQRKWDITIDAAKKANPKTTASVFTRMDTNNDGFITTEEACMDEIKFFATRNVHKAFKMDKDRDGKVSMIESLAWVEYNTLGSTTKGCMMPDELYTAYNIPKDCSGEELKTRLKEILQEMADKIQDEDKKTKFTAQIDEIVESLINEEYTIKNLIEEHKKSMIEKAKNEYGIDLTEEQKQELDNAYKTEFTKYLFRNNNASTGSLYQQLGLDAYNTLLATTEITEGCLGGTCSIKEGSPCLSSFSAENMKARLNYARYGNSNPDVYTQIFGPELMTQEQAELYISYVNEELKKQGKTWDDNDWTLNDEEFHNVTLRINGTHPEQDIDLLDKSTENIPKKRWELHTFLQENDFLDDRFKE